MMSEKMSIDAQTLTILAAYNREKRKPTWVIYNQDDVQYGGVSSEFIAFDEGDSSLVILRDASGREYTVPLVNVTIRVQF